jgi:hypothetical protein
MKTCFIVIVGILLLGGCVSDPMLTGKPQDWKGKAASDLRAGWGEPTRIIPQTGGVEIWEYTKTGELVAPEQNNTSFNMGGGGGANFFRARGGINTTKHEQRLSQYQNIWRFMIRSGKVKKWSAARIVDGQTVWSDH